MVTSKKIAIVGPPSSGKSTLAAQVNAHLKTQGMDSVFIEEYSVDYIAEFGIPQSIEHQRTIFNEQLRRERNFDGKREYIICDSASWLSYIYGRQYFDSKLSTYDVATIAQLHKMVLETIDYWDYIFYIPMLDEYKFDGVRYHNKEESEKLGRMIKGWLEIENFNFIDLTDVELEARLDYVIKTITV